MQATPRPLRQLAAAALALGALVVPAMLPAQQQALDPRRTFATREELQAALTAAQQQATTSSNSKVRAQRQRDVAALSARLREGDLQVGDRVALTVLDQPTLTDTFTVRSGRVLTLPDIPDIPVQGVLRSELQSYLDTQMGKYLREPQVRATPLVRVAVIGPVGQPGFYSFPADMLVGDAIMAAGGPGPRTDLNATEVKRDGQVVYSKEAMQQAFTKGLTLDQINIRAGDQIVVGEKKERSWYQVARTIAVILSVALSAIALGRVLSR